MNDELRKLLEDVKSYIEETQVVLDGEWGSCRTLEQISSQGDMPELYGRVQEILSK